MIACHCRVGSAVVGEGLRSLASLKRLENQRPGHRTINIFVWVDRGFYVFFLFPASTSPCLLDKEILPWLERQNASRPFEASIREDRTNEKAKVRTSIEIYYMQ